MFADLIQIFLVKLSVLNVRKPNQIMSNILSQNPNLLETIDGIVVAVKRICSRQKMNAKNVNNQSQKMLYTILLNLKKIKDLGILIPAAVGITMEVIINLADGAKLKTKLLMVLGETMTMHKEVEQIIFKNKKNQKDLKMIENGNAFVDLIETFFQKKHALNVRYYYYNKNYFYYR